MSERFASADAEAYLRAHSFTTTQIDRVGVEIEWHLRGVDRRAQPILSVVRKALAPLGSGLPGGGCLSFEAGGQLELSSAPGPDLASCVAAATSDAARVTQALSAAGYTLDGRGLDTGRPVSRLVSSERYTALERHYGQFGRAGRLMLHGSASVQVCLDAGDGSAGYRGVTHRWWLANALGPLLSAVFANSPSRRGWRSTRQVLRLLSDPVRARPPAAIYEPAKQWARHVMDTTLVWPYDEPARGTLREYLSSGRTITEKVLWEHVKSVMAPIRATRYLEFRMIDAQPTQSGWIVPTAVVATLLNDGTASDLASAIVDRLPSPTIRNSWLSAAMHGLRSPRLGAAAAECLAVAVDALDRTGQTGLRRMVQQFAERYTFRGCSPADEASTVT